MSLVGIIGGSGLTNLKTLNITRREVLRTPFGEPSAPLVFGELGGQKVVFLARHGHGHTIPPHEVNYRANIWALKEVGSTHVIAVNAVGGITPEMTSGRLAFPDQIIDYTYGRQHTFFGIEQKQVTHVDFTYPYCEALRSKLIAAAKAIKLNAVGQGTYGATQGPRFESIAEIRRMERDGCDIVGMTGMPETGLATELQLCYACVALVVNPAAGKAAGTISLKEIEQMLEEGMDRVRLLLQQALPTITAK
jgi:5'-deoxy-5'-methylthioadenosine phosphorylase